MDRLLDAVILLIAVVVLLGLGVLIHAGATRSQCDNFGLTRLNGETYVCHLKVGP